MSYLRDILDQPQAVADCIAGLAPVPALNRLRADLAAGKYRRIVLTGMGGSCQVLHPLHIRLVAAGHEAALVETSELLGSFPRLLAPDTALLAISQSGASAETVRLLDRVGPRPYTVGLTNTPGSPLASKADLVLWMNAGQESGVSCKTAVTSLVALEWIGEHLCGGDLDSARADLESLPAAMAAYLARSSQHVAELVVRLEGARHFFFVGRGRSLAAAGLGAMIQKEAAHAHGEGMGSAAFRHGPFEMLGPDVFVLVFEGDEHVAPLNRRLYTDIAATPARPDFCGLHGAGPFALPQAPARVAPVLEMLPPQMISLALAQLRGREAGRFERITKVTTVE